MKNIIFIFSGTARTSPFNNNHEKRRMEILDSYNKFIFTDKFKSLYKYKVYISTDNINLEDTINYFSSDNIGNIYLQDTDYYLKNISNKIPNISHFLDIFDKRYDTNYYKWTNSVFVWYKILSCYNLFRNDDVENYDYIIRLRMDVKFIENILDILELFIQKPETEIIMDWAEFAIGKPNIMNIYCTGLENNYGNYKNLLNISNPLIDFNNLDIYMWMYAPERQLFEMLCEYFINNNLDVYKVIVHRYSGIVLIVRFGNETSGFNSDEYKINI